MPAVITEQDARYALDLVESICTKVGPGSPASLQERARALTIANELESHLGAGNVTLEEFTLAPAAFLGSQSLSTLLILLAAGSNIASGRWETIPATLFAVIAVTSASLALLLFICEFVLGREIIDPLCKKEVSLNVIGTLRKPGTQKIRRLLMVSGHHDSALEFTWLRTLGFGYFALILTWLLALVTVFARSAIQVTGLLIEHPTLFRFGTLGWGWVAYPLIPALIFALFFTRRGANGGTVPGAADNLSACALAVSLCRFLVRNPDCIPDDTEIRFITFGSEEAGWRGSRRYVQRHLDELRHLDAQLLNLETIVYPRLAILTSEANGTVKNDPKLVNSLVTAARRAGVPYILQPALLGTAGDAGPFSQAGLQAVTLLGFTLSQMVTFYHQAWDRPDILSLPPFVNALKLALEWIRYGGVKPEDTSLPGDR